MLNAKAKVLPTDRSAEYARTGVMTNTERYNLKISDNISKNRRCNIAHLEPTADSIDVSGDAESIKAALADL